MALPVVTPVDDCFARTLPLPVAVLVPALALTGAATLLAARSQFIGFMNEGMPLALAVLLSAVRGSC